MWKLSQHSNCNLITWLLNCCSSFLLNAEQHQIRTKIKTVLVMTFTSRESSSIDFSEVLAPEAIQAIWLSHLSIKAFGSTKQSPLPVSFCWRVQFDHKIPVSPNAMCSHNLSSVHFSVFSIDWLRLLKIWALFKKCTSRCGLFRWQSEAFFFVFFFFFSFLPRTLLALGCHVAQTNIHAEDDLKKIKLPKEYVSINSAWKIVTHSMPCPLKSMASFPQWFFFKVVSLQHVGEFLGCVGGVWQNWLTEFGILAEILGCGVKQNCDC